MKSKPFKLPRFVRFTHDVKYKVQLVDAFDDPLQLGECWDGDKSIKLLRKLKGRKLEKTFWHEVVHAFCLTHKIKLSFEEEERLATALENHLTKFFKLNELRFK